MSLEDLEQKRELVRQRKLKEEQEAASSTEIIQDKPAETDPVNDDENNQPHVFLAFARVFSGSIRKGQELFILSPKHQPEDFIGKVGEPQIRVCLPEKIIYFPRNRTSISILTSNEFNKCRNTFKKCSLKMFI